MSQENVEIVRGFFDATERAIAAYWENPRSLGDAMKTDDLDPESKDAWKSLHPDVVWNTGDFGTYRGRLEIAVAWDDLFEVADDYRTAVRELTDCGGIESLRPLTARSRPRGAASTQRSRFSP